MIFNNKIYIIAEAGVNHNGNLQMALELVRIAKESGADAVKFQSFKAENLALQNAPKAAYQGNGSQYEMLKNLELNESQHYEIKKYADELKIDFLSTPFDVQSADMLGKLGVKAYKISSGDLTNYPLLKAVTAKNKPIIISTGMANLEEVEFGIRIVGVNAAALLHCVSNYPAAEADCNMLAMKTIAEKFGLPVGWSDHTDNDVTAIMAVSLGASIIEKHITLDRNLPGPDHVASYDPVQFRNYVRNVRLAEEALGDGKKLARKAELEVAMVAKRAVIVSAKVKKGDVFRDSNLTTMRPAKGISAREYENIIGKVAAVDIPPYTALEPEMILGYL